MITAPQNGRGSGARWRRAVALPLALLACGAAACRTPAPAASVGVQAPVLVQPGAPGTPARPISPDEASDLSGVAPTAADAAFVRGMIAHHAQALEMTALVGARSRSDRLRLLAQRIEASQADEIAMMRDWLDARGFAEPASSAHASHHHDAPMPGMLTAAQMAALAAASGEAFDRLFLELMIAHHQGALAMVQALVAQPGAAQDPELFAFASDVEADQGMEIARMLSLLGDAPR